MVNGTTKIVDVYLVLCTYRINKIKYKLKACAVFNFAIINYYWFIRNDTNVCIKCTPKKRLISN